MTTPAVPTPPDNTPERPKYRVPVGIPQRGENRREGAIISVLLHLGIIALLIIPLFSTVVIKRIEQGAGGPGPAGGGGGGHLSTDQGSHESLRFVHVTTQPVVTPKAVPKVPPPVPKPTPKIPPPVPPPMPKVLETAVTAPAAPMQNVTAVAGTGAGTGADGTNGNGPGSGGGVGSGQGTGRGSANGPGTGGGTQANYPPQPIEFFLPPLPPPASVRGFQFIADFDVDSTGKVLDMQFTSTRDGDYNRRLTSVLHSMKFRPGTRPDGTPIRMKAQIIYSF